VYSIFEEEEEISSLQDIIGGRKRDLHTVLNFIVTQRRRRNLHTVLNFIVTQRRRRNLHIVASCM
jgi:hypothetical protein